MTLTVQSLRSDISGIQPGKLLPGQIAFNLADKVVFIGDGSDQRREPDGTITPAPQGGGWFATSIDVDQFLPNPIKYDPTTPSDGDVLTYDSLIKKPVWTDPLSVTISAANVSYDPAGTGLPTTATDVQTALTLTNIEAVFARSVADLALARSGGTMSGYITFFPGQPVDAGTF